MLGTTQVSRASIGNGLETRYRQGPAAIFENPRSRIYEGNPGRDKLEGIGLRLGKFSLYAYRHQIVGELPVAYFDTMPTIIRVDSLDGRVPHPSSNGVSDLTAVADTGIGWDGGQTDIFQAHYIWRRRATTESVSRSGLTMVVRSPYLAVNNEFSHETEDVGSRIFEVDTGEVVAKWLSNFISSPNAVVVNRDEVPDPVITFPVTGIA